jgi:hypothetical protein
MSLGATSTPTAGACFDAGRFTATIRENTIGSTWNFKVCCDIMNALTFYDTYRVSGISYHQCKRSIDEKTLRLVKRH